VNDFDYHDMDIDLPTCEKCGNPLTGDSDGDGVWATPVYFCEHCPDEDDPTLHGEQPREETPGG
jgi:hypothetical protein